MRHFARNLGLLLLACLCAAPKDPVSDKASPERVSKKEAVFEVKCPKEPSKRREIKRSEVYKETPYKSGERAEYEVRYMGALAGTGWIDVKPPFKHKGSGPKPFWHRKFQAEAKTGDWFKMIFVAHDKLHAIIQPWDSAIAKFYIEQDEGKLFGRRLQQKKWLDFNHDACDVQVKQAEVGKKEKVRKYPLARGAMDTLGAVFWLREQDFKLGKPRRTLVYSSEKNWWLEARPMVVEEIEVKAGKFPKAMKLNLQTYIGQELQQKGDVNVWIDTMSKERPIVQIQGEIEIGSVWMELASFKPGRG